MYQRGAEVTLHHSHPDCKHFWTEERWGQVVCLRTNYANRWSGIESSQQPQLAAVNFSWRFKLKQQQHMHVHVEILLKFLPTIYSIKNVNYYSVSKYRKFNITSVTLRPTEVPNTSTDPNCKSWRAKAAEGRGTCKNVAVVSGRRLCRLLADSLHPAVSDKSYWNMGFRNPWKLFTKNSPLGIWSKGFLNFC